MPSLTLFARWHVARPLVWALRCTEHKSCRDLRALFLVLALLALERALAADLTELLAELERAAVVTDQGKAAVLAAHQGDAA